MDLLTSVEMFTQVITYAMIVAGFPSCITMLRTKDIKGVPYPFFLAGTVNSMMSIGYGLLVGNNVIVQINVFATFCNTFYIAAFLYSSTSKRLPVVQLAGCASFVVVTYVYITRIVNPSAVMGNIGVLLLMCSTVLLLTPLLQVKQCIEDKSAVTISLTMLIAGFLCCSAWGLYGLLLKDVYIFAPNVVGVTSYLCQAASILIYGRIPQKSRHVD